MNIACAIVDVCESTLTLRVGNDSVVFKAEQEKKNEGMKNGEISLVDLDDEVLERKLALLQEENPNKFLLPSEGNFDVEEDLKEIERLLEEAESKETTKIVETSQTRRVASTDSTSPIENLTNHEDLILLLTRSLSNFDIHTSPDPLESPIEEAGIVENFNFQHAQLAYLDTIIKEEAIQLDVRVILGEK